MVTRRVVVPVLPDEVGCRDGLAYSLWLPGARTLTRGGIVVLHGAGSCKESHHPFCRAAQAAGFAVLAFDARGHGESQGSMDGRALDDVGAMASLLREHLAPGARLVLRGSSMGGYLSLAGASAGDADAVVAISPASAEGLRRGLLSGRFPAAADVEGLSALLAAHDLAECVGALEVPVLLLHAEGDEIVPVQGSRELARGLTHPDSRLIVVPGGHHRSVQHDAELQAVSLRWLGRVLGGA